MNAQSALSKSLVRLPLVLAIAVAVVPLVAVANPLTHGNAKSTARVLLPRNGQVTPYIVLFEKPSLSQQSSTLNLPRLAGVSRPDVTSAPAQQYVQLLRSEQDVFLSRAGVALGRPLTAISPKYRFYYAVNGMAVRLKADEADKLSKMAGVKLVVPMRLIPVAVASGPGLIGAGSFWSGLYDNVTDRIFRSDFDGPSPLANHGEGVVLGDIDTGLNFSSKSFTPVTASGYQHVNPLGAGNYLGACAPGQTGVWTPQCNAKIIGAYEFVDDLMPDIQADDPGAVNGPGPEDENGHGSHTASTAAGNAVMAQVPGGPLVSISGVAPHANIVVYDACYTDGTGVGTCPSISLTAAIDQAVADGIVDVINYSIGGGNSPWEEPESLAFLDATNVGIFVAAAAGNSGPSAGSISHVEPWVTTVAASTDGDGPFLNKLAITAPQPVPPELQNITITFADTVPLDHPISGALGYNDADPTLCTAPAPGAYANNILVVRRGTCTFVSKILNAETAGATAVILVNTSDAALNPSLTGTHIPVGVLPKSQGDVIVAFKEAATSPVMASLEYPAVPSDNVVDQIARFSSRGPVDGLPLLKPDVAAPGVNILAAFAGGPDSFAVLDGTSMATPHVAGAAILLRKSHPDWTTAQLKSALMLTAKTDGVTLQGTSNPAGPLDRGAGRIQADLAYRSGLLMNESSYNYLRANPAMGGKPETLNVPSLGANHCVGNCEFSRKFTSTGSLIQHWTASLDNLNGSVTPGSFSIAPGSTQSIGFDVSVDGLSQDDYATGSVKFTPSSADSPELHMPVAVYVDPFKLDYSPASLSASVDAGSSTTVSFTITNSGNAGLTWDLMSGVHAVPVVNQVPNTLDGLVSSLYADGNNGAYVADDIDLDQPTTFHKLSVPGFLFANYQDTLDMYASTLTWSIYADNSGKPAGFPGDGTQPLWTFTAAPDATGVTPATNAIEVDLDAAGQNLTLPPGKYWLVAYPTFSAHTVNGVSVIWFRFLLNTQSGDVGKTLNNDPTFGGDPSSTSWGDLSADFPGHFDAAMVGTADRQCTPSWVTASKVSGNLGADQSDAVVLAVDATNLSAGTYVGQLCLDSNDASKPISIVPIQLTVN